MAATQPTIVHADADRLKAAVAGIFAATGVPAEEAALVGHYLVLADLRGVGTHGISRVPIYAERIRRGLVTAKPDLRITRPMPAAVHVDGDNGLGFLVMRRATQEAIGAAAQCGIGIASVSNSTHFGMAAAYLLEAVEAGYAAFVFTNASPSMPVWGGRTPFLGTSPFAFGAPRAYEGIVLPLGGPKGSGLSLMMEVIAGVMSGSAYGGQVGDQYRGLDRPQNVGHSVIAFKPDLFLDRTSYAGRMDDLVGRARDCPRVDESQPILMPGEPEAARMATRLKDGIPLAEDDLAMLREQATLAGIDIDIDALGKV